MLVVNLFGAPGAGKSTAAAYIFSILKMEGVNAELVTEFAKDKVWEENKEVFKPDNQLYMFGKQFYRMSRCRGKVDVLVCDSPLLLNACYNKSELLGDVFDNLVENVFNSFDNRNFLLVRDQPYDPRGRLQTEEESDAIYVTIKEHLDKIGIPYTSLLGNKENYGKIANCILQEWRTKTDD